MNEKEIMEYAKAIKQYCSNITKCSTCCFQSKRNKEYLGCILSYQDLDGEPYLMPCDWEIKEKNSTDKNRNI